jgi:hypothetical protein
LRCEAFHVEKEVVVGEASERVSAVRPGRDWTSQLLHPAEPPLASGMPVKQISIDYPQLKSYIHGANWWVAYFFVVSMLTAIVLKPFFGVHF